MSRVKSTDTTPELFVRSCLHHAGYRFRLHVKELPGKPDIVLPKYKTVVDVRGCFWHQHPGCQKSSIPATNSFFWKEKLGKNVERDSIIKSQLQSNGWNVYVIWECKLKTSTQHLIYLLNSQKTKSAEKLELEMIK